MKYPIEIEFTDFCGLKCLSCVNPLLKNKGFMSVENYMSLLDYLFFNRENILYINFSGIGDIFLHNNIMLFLDLFLKKFKNTGVHLLIPTKGQSVTDEHLDLLVEFKENGINLNVSIGIYSLIKEKHNIFSGSNSFEQTILFIKKLKKNDLDFSLELLKSSTNSEELPLFRQFIKRLRINGAIHNYHNFSGSIENEEYVYGDESCSFDGTSYAIADSYCSFIPLLSQNGKIYTCSISGKKNNFLIGESKELFLKYPHYIDLVNYIYRNHLNKNKCSECSIYKSSI